MNTTVAHDDPARDADTSAQSVFTSEGGWVDTRPAEVEDTVEQKRQMVELGVYRVGRGYRFLGYRYDRREDAIAYARLVRSRASQHLPEDAATAAFFADDDHPPAVSDEPLMASLNISYMAGRYRFAHFSYGLLADAVAYAKRQHLP